MSQPLLRCSQAQIALSAMLDHEQAQVDSSLVATHLASCTNCQTWQAAAERTTRGLRLQVVRVPDLTESILAATNADPRIGTNAELVRGQRRILQVALAISAFAQLLLAVPSLLAAPGAAGAQVEWEMASLAVAVAAGYLCVARQPARARAFIPVAVMLSICLMATGIRDVVVEPSMLAHNLGHLLALVQLGLLAALVRVVPEPSRAGLRRRKFIAPLRQAGKGQQMARAAQ